MELTALSRKIQHIPPEQYPAAGQLVTRFLDVIGTATGQATYYNQQTEQQQAVEEIHQAVFELDRGLYGALHLLPGVLDYARQMAVCRLLGQSRTAGQPCLLDLGQETGIIEQLTDSLPPQRQAKLFGQLKAGRVNNRRSRRLILETILNQANLEWQAVKYRRKLRTALSHAWGQHTTGIIRSILSKPMMGWDRKERDIIGDQIDRYLIVIADNQIYELVRFILGGPGPWQMPLLAAYDRVPQDFQAGAVLPPEVMEGLRSVYHPGRSSADVLDLTKRQATAGQQLRQQRTAWQHKIALEFDPKRYNPVELYIYAYEMGLTGPIRQALQAKAKAAARQLPFHFDSIGLVIDASDSMAGHHRQKHRPIAISLALRDLLSAASEQQIIIYCGGEPADLPQPAGATALAPALVEVIAAQPEAVFILSDGYENAPAGRVAEVMTALRDMGQMIPVYQLSPVLAAETFGSRALSPDIPVLPVNQNVGSVGLGMIKLLLARDFIRGLAALLQNVKLLEVEHGSNNIG